MPVESLTPTVASVPRLVTLWLLSSVISAPDVVGFIEPSAVTRTSSAAPLLAVVVAMGVVRAVVTEVSA